VDVDPLMAAGPQMSVTQQGAGKAAVDLHKLGDRASDVRRVSEKVRSVYRKSNERRFQRDGDGDWPRLADTTEERKAREGLDPRPLRATDRLYRSLTSTRATGQVDVRDPTEFRFGTEIPYARFHDTGRGVPTRKLIEFTPAERKQITELISGYVAKGRQ
jgi:phage gpG-like protein